MFSRRDQVVHSVQAGEASFTSLSSTTSLTSNILSVTNASATMLAPGNASFTMLYGGMISEPSITTALVEVAVNHSISAEGTMTFGTVVTETIDSMFDISAPTELVLPSTGMYLISLGALFEQTGVDTAVRQINVFGNTDYLFSIAGKRVMGEQTCFVLNNTISANTLTARVTEGGADPVLLASPSSFLGVVRLGDAA